jgi:hypothetical protein
MCRYLVLNRVSVENEISENEHLNFRVPTYFTNLHVHRITLSAPLKHHFSRLKKKIKEEKRKEKQRKLIV